MSNKSGSAKKAPNTRVRRNAGRSQILKAALELFAERGLDAVTTREIALKAGVSVPLIWHHFESKDQLKRQVDEYVIKEAKRIWSKDHRKHAKDIISSSNKVDKSWAKEMRSIAPHIRRIVTERTDKSRELIEIFGDLACTFKTEFLSEYDLMESCSQDDLEEIILILMLGPLMLSEALEVMSGKSLYSSSSVFHRKDLYGKMMLGGLLVAKSAKRL